MDDRRYAVGDILLIQEWDNEEQRMSCEMQMPHIQAKPICVTCSVQDEHYKDRKLADWKQKGHKKIVVKEFVHVGTEYV